MAGILISYNLIYRALSCDIAHILVLAKCGYACGLINPGLIRIQLSIVIAVAAHINRLHAGLGISDINIAQRHIGA